MVTVYLSGGMGNVSFEEQTKWRNAIRNEVLYGAKDITENVKFFSPPDYYNFEDVRHKSEKEIMDYDLYVLRRSDVVIVNFNDEKSIGTAMELMLAKEYNIPVIGINIDGKELHPWLTESVTRMCDSLREAVDYLIDFFLN